ncbi:hypothetical protein EVJ58_g1061 [Rhodofomes roseus]|uniref:SCP domain-containing protein n=1 Tax=Rhodofomes roseus TaxID=34475 RepID=A0A4Y9Z3C9_9APHY|nr:hypothetical protein EVJ58_g1061 [Rhodofomes roseus]
MNRVLLLFLTIAVVLALVPEGLAGLVYGPGHRYHKRSDLKKRMAEAGHVLTPRYAGNVKRQSCRVRPSSAANSTIASVTQPAPSSSTQDSSTSVIVTTTSAFVQPEVVFSPSPSDPAPSPAVTTEVQQDPSPAPTTSTSEAPAPTTTTEAPPPSSTISSTTEAAPTTSASSSSGSSSGTSQSDIDKYLDDHNTVRAQHGASPLTWDDTLAAAAQQWANGCVFKHSGGTLGPYGENLAAGTGDSYGIDQAIQSWTDEVSQYNANSPEASHFTQVVWKASTKVGCAVQDCDGIFASSFGKAHYYVCEYSPQGNVIGEFA